MRPKLIFCALWFAASACGNDLESPRSDDASRDAQVERGTDASPTTDQMDGGLKSTNDGKVESEKDSAAAQRDAAQASSDAGVAPASFEFADSAVEYANADARELEAFCRFYSEKGAREYDVVGECTAAASWDLGPGEACEMQRAKCIAEDNSAAEHMRAIEDCRYFDSNYQPSCKTTLSQYQTCVEEMAASRKLALKNFNCNKKAKITDWIGAPSSCTGLEACRKTFPTQF